MLSVPAARAAALFTSHLSATSRPSRADVDEAIQAAVRSHGGSRGCAADVAAAFGEYPELAVPRMRWAREVVAEAYPGKRPAQSAYPPERVAWLLERVVQAKAAVRREPPAPKLTADQVMAEIYRRRSS